MSVVEILEAAKALIDTSEKWTQGACARTQVDEDGYLSFTDMVYDSNI